MREQRTIQLDHPSEGWPAEDPRAPVPNTNRSDLTSALASQVRNIYCICYRDFSNDPEYGRKHMPRWDGGETAHGSTHRPVWPRIAAVIVAQDADPLQFIRAQFVGVRRATPPRPNQLYNEEAVARWQNYRFKAQQNLERQVASDLNQIKVHVLPFTVNLGWDYRTALAYVLKDRRCGASSLVRYCAAVAESLPIAAAFRERALLQYMFQMADYDSLLGNKVPQELRAEAAELRELLVGQ